MKRKLNEGTLELNKLNAGDQLAFSGIIYTCRDQAHKRLVNDIVRKKKIPFCVKGAIFYYCGPTNTPKGKIIGSCGPTTSSRMDAFTPFLLGKGVSAMIGKGRRSKEVVGAIKKHKAVYLLAPAGCGALVSKYIKRKEPVAYADLGPEQILKLKVEDLPLVVAIDSKGRSIYDQN